MRDQGWKGGDALRGPGNSADPFWNIVGGKEADPAALNIGDTVQVEHLRSDGSTARQLKIVIRKWCTDDGHTQVAVRDAVGDELNVQPVMVFVMRNTPEDVS